MPPSWSAYLSPAASPVAEQLDKDQRWLPSLAAAPWRLEETGPDAAAASGTGRAQRRVLLVGCGKERELDERQYKQIINKTITALNETGSMRRSAS